MEVWEFRNTVMNTVRSLQDVALARWCQPSYSLEVYKSFVAAVQASLLGALFAFQRLGFLTCPVALGPSRMASTNQHSSLSP